MPQAKAENTEEVTIIEGQPGSTAGSSNDGEGDPNPDFESHQEDEIEVLIGDAEPEVVDNDSWVQDVRRRNRELARQNRELQQRLIGQPAVAVEIPKVGRKPTIDDFNLDTDAYEAALDKWYKDSAKVEAAQAEAKRLEDQQRDQMSAKLTAYRADAAKLKIPDFEDYEAAVMAELDTTQQGIIVNWSSKAALVMAALGRNPKQLAALAKIKDPMSFGWQISKLEDKLKTAPKKPSTAPERKIGGGGVSMQVANGGTDARLDQLRTEAVKTGDMTKVIAYKRELRARTTK